MPNLHNWLGLIAVIVAAQWLYRSWVHARRFLAERDAATASGSTHTGEGLHPSLAALGAVAPGIIGLGIMFLAALLVMFYVALDGPKTISLFDLVGMLFAMACYWVFLTIKTTFRRAFLPAPVPVDASEAPAPTGESQPD